VNSGLQSSQAKSLRFPNDGRACLESETLTPRGTDDHESEVGDPAMKIAEVEQSDETIVHSPACCPVDRVTGRDIAQ
jgi:hypothetical protein